MGLEVECTLAVESEDLSRGNNIALGEDNQFGIFIRVFGLTFPVNLDGVRSDIVHAEFTDTEDG